jgi:hypothetical protein
MNDNYSKYLLLMALAILGAVCVAAVITARRRKPGVAKAPAVKVRPVDSGSISVFFDRAGNATIIPYVADLFGEGKATAEVIGLPRPYSAAQLGAAIRSALASCRGAKPAGSAKLMERLGTPSWKTFSEGKANLSVYYKEGAGIVFNTTVRTPEGGYAFNRKGIEHSLSADDGDEQIGRNALELLKQCRF